MPLLFYFHPTLILLHSLLGVLVSPLQALDNFSHPFFHSQILKNFPFFFFFLWSCLIFHIQARNKKNDFMEE